MIVAACLAAVTALAPVRVLAQRPAACTEALAGLQQARTVFAQALPQYQRMTPEQRSAEDAAMRAQIGPMLQSFASAPGAAIVNTKVRDAVGRSLFEIVGGVRAIPDAGPAIEALATAFERVCAEPPPSAEETARADAAYRFDRALDALDREIEQREGDLAAARHRQRAFESAFERSGVAALEGSLRSQLQEIDQDLRLGAAGTLVDIAGTILPKVEALGSGAHLAIERLMLFKDKSTAVTKAAQFAQAATSPEPLTRSDYENAATAAVSTLSLAAAVATATTAGAAAGTAAAFIGGLATLAGATLAAGGIVAGYLEVGLLARSRTDVASALTASTGKIAQHRTGLANRIRVEEQLLQPLRERRARIEAARKRHAADR